MWHLRCDSLRHNEARNELHLLDRLDLLHQKRRQFETRISLFDGILIAGESVHQLVSVDEDKLTLTPFQLREPRLVSFEFLFECHKCSPPYPSHVDVPRRSARY